MSRSFFRRSAGPLIAGLALLGGAAGCGSGDEAPPGAPVEAPTDSGPKTQNGDSSYMLPVGSPCTEGAMKACKVLLPAHGSIHPCFVGVQICVGGTWGHCVERPEAGPPSDAAAVK